jgi:putative CocE/NonD family hydrolase
MIQERQVGHIRALHLLCITLLVLTTVTLGAGPISLLGTRQISEDRYEAVVVKDVMIPMRDGIKLAADIYRPAIDGVPLEDKLPILLQRTPYGKEVLVERATYFARHRYVVVVQDCRGRYKSEGVFTKYLNEAEDGYDTIEWLAQLPYTDGQVGMWGLSYGAHVQAAAAQLDPPHLKTILVDMGGTYNGWDHAILNHGVLRIGQLKSAFASIRREAKRNPAVFYMLEQERVEDWILAFPFRKGLSPLSAAPNVENYIFEMLAHAAYGDYWKQIGLNWSIHYPETSDIPMLHISGWYDTYCGTAIGNYVGLHQIKKGPIRLLMGPWTHAGHTRTYAGEVEFGPSAAIEDYFSTAMFHLRWFDHFLKGKKNGVARQPPVKIFVMGTGNGHKHENGRLYHGGYWRKGKKWPLEGTKYTKYYFHGDGTLSPKLPNPGSLPITYTYDPRDPVPTIGGSGSLSWGGAFDQRERENKGNPSKGFFGSKPPYLPLKARPDIVVFQTEPLTEEVEVIGPITVVFYASSTAPDTDFTAKLIDVYPPSQDFPSGFEMNITDDIIRARFRNSPEKPELMKAGEIYEFVIEPFPTANVFKKGHRIRIDISSSNFPRFDRNPNTGEPIGMSRRMVTADNSIYVDREHSSHVILPIIPANQAR